MQQSRNNTLTDLPGPIGVFDSGYGGLTVLKDLVHSLPRHNFIYLGDNARTPYGTRSFDVVLEYTLQAVNRLFDMGCHLVILACNTASAKALRTIQQKHLPHIDPKRRVLGVIRPSVEIVGNLTKSKQLGVFGTSGTIQSESYPIEINKLHPDLHVYSEACPMWVPLVENGEAESAGADYFVKQHVDRLFAKAPDIDTVILGCTHYPILLNKIKSYMPDGLTVISQGRVIAESLKDYLHRHPEMDEKILKASDVAFYTTENPEKFNDQARLFYGNSIHAQHISL